MNGVLALCLGAGVAGAGGSTAAAEGPRLVVSSRSVYATTESNFRSGSGEDIVMRYDLAEDPRMQNGVNAWDGGRDVYGKTAYDYTRWGGPLGIYGPLGPFGPLGAFGALPHRFVGSVNSSAQESYWNSWCASASDEPDRDCVYGSYGALGESGPLTEFQCYNTMYHLQEETYWYNDYNHNLDISGVWGIQGPLGPTGSLGALGPLGPLGVSLQAGMTTGPSGEYLAAAETANETAAVLVRETQPVRFRHDASERRGYRLFEMYGRDHAARLSSGGAAAAGGDANDAAFAVDASTVLLGRADGGDGEVSVTDTYAFRSLHDEFVSINVVPFGGDAGKGASWQALALSLSLACGGAPVESVAADISAANPQSGLMPFIVARTAQNEECAVTVRAAAPAAALSERDAFTGYYLFVTGSGLSVIDSNGVVDSNPDIWGARQQADGTFAHNIEGAHQIYV